jgi:hypothetical protein
VVDASIMPLITSGHLVAVAYVFGEKASAVMKVIGMPVPKFKHLSDTRTGQGRYFRTVSLSLSHYYLVL